MAKTSESEASAWHKSFPELGAPFSGPDLCSRPSPGSKFKFWSSERFFSPFNFWPQNSSRINKPKSTIKLQKSPVFEWRYLDCLLSKFLEKTLVWKLILWTTFFEAIYFPQRLWYVLKSWLYKQYILHLTSRRYEPVDTRRRTSVGGDSRKARWIVVTEIVGDVIYSPFVNHFSFTVTAIFISFHLSKFSTYISYTRDHNKPE